MPTTNNSNNYYITRWPQDDLEDHTWQAKKYKFYGIGSAVGFIAVAVIGNIAIHILFPAYFFTGAISALLLMTAVPPFSQRMLKISSNYKTAAKIDELILDRLVKFFSLSPSEKSREFSVHGLHYSPKLAFVFSRYLVWKQQVVEIELEAKKWLIEAKKLTDPNEAKQLRLKALDHLYNDKRDAKLRAAYFYGLAQHPEFMGSIEDLCDIYSYSYEDRLIAREAGGKEAEEFIKFKENRFEPLNVSSFDVLTIPLVAARIFRAA